MTDRRRGTSADQIPPGVEARLARLRTLCVAESDADARRRLARSGLLAVSRSLPPLFGAWMNCARSATWRTTFIAATRATAPRVSAVRSR